MSWGEELVKIRRFLRDPNGTIWSDAFLRGLYNDVQNDFQHKTDVLEDVLVQRVPGLYQMAYMFEWEWRFLPGEQTQFYQCLHLQGDDVFCHRWEQQEVSGIASDVTEDGIHLTQPWEAFMGQLPADAVKMRFPHNFNKLKYAAYDERPLTGVSKKQVQSNDSSYLKTEGTPIAFYPYDDTGQDYVLYPRPSVSFVNEIDGDQR